MREAAAVQFSEGNCKLTSNCGQSRFTPWSYEFIKCMPVNVGPHVVTPLCSITYAHYAARMRRGQ